MIRALAPELERCDPGRLSSAKLPHLGIVVAMSDDPGPGMFRFRDVQRLGGPAQQLRLDAITETLDPDDPINVQFTSGTTGAPKGATLTHYNIVNNARFVTDRIRFCDGQIAHYKAPEHVRIVDELPVTVTGKPQKFVMRDRMVEHGYADADPAGGSA